MYKTFNNVENVTLKRRMKTLLQTMCHYMCMPSMPKSKKN